MERVVDLDAARVARAEVQGEPPVVVLGGERFTLPHEMPFTVMEALIARDREGFMRPLLGDSYDRFWALGLSAEDRDEFIEQVLTVYGMSGGSGNSSASGGSSKNNGRRSKPTSPATTKSISAKRAGGKMR